MTIDNAEMKQNEFNATLSALSDYAPRNQKYIEAKNKLLDNVKSFYEGREKIIKDFKYGIFLLKSYDESKKQQTSKKIMKKNPLKNQHKLI